jgi:hypothetical protein
VWVVHPGHRLHRQPAELFEVCPRQGWSAVTDKDLNLPMQTSSAVTSQATDVEKSRAIAHVQAAYTVADARPRVERLALERMLETCSLLGMAERAFFRFPPGR